MPRCQRTFRRLPPGSTVPGSGITCWQCPHCDDHESYESIRDPDLLSYAAIAGEALCREYGAVPDPHFSLCLLRAQRPECVRESGENRYDLYLQRGADGQQMRLQIGHEMFHRVCSRGRVFHWTHEMFACLMSVRFLRRWGAAEYADAMETLYFQEAQLLSIRQMRVVDLWSACPYPPGLYGRAYRTGIELIEAVGITRLNQMLRVSLPDGSPDISAWYDTLRTSDQKAVNRVLSFEAVNNPADEPGATDFDRGIM